MTRTLKTSAVLVLALATACGGSSKGGASSATPTDAEAKAAAAAINLLAADLPGFTGSAHDDTKDPEEEAAKRTFQECLGLTYQTDEQRDVAHVYSEDLSKGSGDTAPQISSDVEVVKSSTQPKADLKAYTSSKAAACVGSFVQAAAKSGIDSPGVNVGTPAVTKVDVPASGTDGAFGYDLTVPVTGAGGSVSVYVSLRGVLKKHTEVSVTTFSVAQPFDKAALDAALSKVVERTKQHAV